MKTEDTTTMEPGTIEREDVFPDSRLEGLLEEWQEDYTNEDNFTWLDQDSSVAWSCPEEESLHGKARAILLRANWDPCYHREGSLFHYNVKINGNQAFRSFWDNINAEVIRDINRIEQIADNQQESELEFFWENLGEDFKESHNEELGKYWQCGRQGGYLNIPEKESLSGVSTMLRLAQILARSKDYYNSSEYGKWLAEESINRYNEEKLAELASPKIERIEA